MRTHYNNGDPVILVQNGCDACKPVMINKSLVHEHGCPMRWKDETRTCRECGDEFTPGAYTDWLCATCQHDTDDLNHHMNSFEDE